MGTAPSADLLAPVNAREPSLRDTDPQRVPPLSLPPLPHPPSSARSPPVRRSTHPPAAEAARTALPRENGGNQDIKNLTKGSRIFYPVYVPGRESVRR